MQTILLDEHINVKVVVLKSAKGNLFVQYTLAKPSKTSPLGRTLGIGNFSKLSYNTNDPRPLEEIASEILSAKLKLSESSLDSIDSLNTGLTKYHFSALDEKTNIFYSIFIHSRNKKEGIKLLFQYLEKNWSALDYDRWPTILASAGFEHINFALMDPLIFDE